MTVIPCPHGCGGVVNTATDNWCPSCRRGLAQVEFPKDGWCWAWWGPSNHRMRCRLPNGHGGEHWDHEERDEESIIVSVDGDVIPVGEKS